MRASRALSRRDAPTMARPPLRVNSTHINGASPTPIGDSIRKRHVSRRIAGKHSIDHAHHAGHIDPPYERTFNAGMQVRSIAKLGVAFFIHAFGLDAGISEQPVRFVIISEEERP